jgi:hypothetical protein
MTKLNRHLLRTLGLSWLGFLIVGLLISWVFAVPKVVVLIDRSYCPPAQWQRVTQSYEQLYRQHQHQELEIQQVILFSDLGKDILSPPPAPEVIRDVSTYGRSDPDRAQDIQRAYPNAQLLACR